MKKKLCFVLDEFLFGGIERVLINYVKEIDYDLYDVDIIILSRVEDMVKQIPSTCHIIQIPLNRYACPLSRASTMVRRKGGAFAYYASFVIKKLIEPYHKLRFLSLRKKQYDVVIAFSGHLNDMYASLHLLNGNKRIVWTHGMIFTYLLLSPAFEKMYKDFDCIMNINHIDQRDIFIHKPYLSYRIENIYNPVTLAAQADDEDISQYGDFILSVARFCAPKDFITLLDAFDMFIKDTGRQENLVIVGDGEDRQKIENHLNVLGIQDRVFLVGSKNNVYQFYHHAKLFVLSSKAEGLPTVMVEAMLCALPVIATDAPYGANDILRGNEYGLLVPVENAKAMKEAMTSLLINSEVYEHYRKQSIRRSKDFAPDAIMEQFYEVLETL